jgi:hypothetical protein
MRSSLSNLPASIIRGERLYARDVFRPGEYDLYALRRPRADCTILGEQA